MTATPPRPVMNPLDENTLAAIKRVREQPASECACGNSPDPYRVEALRLAIQSVGLVRDLDHFFPLVQAWADAYEQDLRDETAGANA